MSKIAIVTGGTRGIGKGIALKLLHNGYKVLINGTTNKNLPNDFFNNVIGINNIAQFQERLSYIQADISKLEDRIKIVEFIQSNYNRLDLLINNAGVAPNERMDILIATEESYDRVMNINLKGPYFLTQKIANIMINYAKDNKLDSYHPKIINITSISAYTSSPSRGEYCLSKAGLSMMTKLYADRLAEFNIGVFEIQPGIIQTDMTSNVKEKYDKLFENGLTPIDRWGTPDDVALAVLSIAKDMFPYSTGQVFNIDGGFHLRRL